MNFKAGDIVMPTIDIWVSKGFNIPKKIQRIKNNCALLCNNFTSAHVSNLRLATKDEIDLYIYSGSNLKEEYKISTPKQKRTDKHLLVWFEYVDVLYFLN